MSVKKILQNGDLMNITVLGSTGSIGTSTLDVVRQHSQKFRVFALVAGKNLPLLVSQILEFRPRMAVVAHAASLDELARVLKDSGLPGSEWPVLSAASQARVVAATEGEVDFVMSAIVGVAGLEATFQAI